MSWAPNLISLSAARAERRRQRFVSIGALAEAEALRHTVNQQTAPEILALRPADELQAELLRLSRSVPSAQARAERDYMIRALRAALWFQQLNQPDPAA